MEDFGNDSLLTFYFTEFSSTTGDCFFIFGILSDLKALNFYATATISQHLFLVFKQA